MGTLQEVSPRLQHRLELTLVPGLYKWGTGVSVSKDVTLSGGSNDVWIFQIAGSMTQANATRVTLAGGAQAKNVFWQAAGVVAIGTTAHFEGIMLAKTNIAVKTGASANGRLLAQTAVTLQENAVTQPAPCERTLHHGCDRGGGKPWGTYLSVDRGHALAVKHIGQ